MSIAVNGKKLLPLIIIAVLAMAGISYALVVFFVSGSQIPKVTWTDSYGAVIQSVNLTYTPPGSANVTVKFTCSPSAGPVSLKLAGVQPTVTISQTNFATCNTTPDTVTITASSTGAVNLDGTLHVTQTYNNYRTLAAPLGIIVKTT
jgi:hypothetical protein